MINFISKWGTLCASIASIIALFAIFYKPIKKCAAKKKAERKAFEDNVLKSLATIEKDLKSLSDDVAELQCDRLAQAHAYYMQQGWCSASRKKILCNWKRSYTSKGYDHLVDSYEKDINGLPETPPEKSKLR